MSDYRRSHVLGFCVTIVRLGEVPFGGNLYRSYHQDIPQW